MALGCRSYETSPAILFIHKISPTTYLHVQYKKIALHKTQYWLCSQIHRFLPIINFSCLLVWLSPSHAPVKLNNTLFHKNTEAPWSSLLLLLKNRKSEAQTQVVQVHKASLWKSWFLPNNQLPVLFRDFFLNFTLWPQFGEGNGNPLQYSCLEKPMDRGAWRATVHGIAESDATKQLIHTHTHTHTHTQAHSFNYLLSFILEPNILFYDLNTYMYGCGILWLKHFMCHWILFSGYLSYNLSYWYRKSLGNIHTFQLLAIFIKF